MSRTKPERRREAVFSGDRGLPPGLLDRLDAMRRKVSFKWWLVYDVLIAIGMVVLFTELHGWEILLPVALAGALAFSAFLDVIEFFVKRRMERDIDEFNKAWDREHKARGVANDKQGDARAALLNLGEQP